MRTRYAVTNSRGIQVDAQRCGTSTDIIPLCWLSPGHRGSVGRGAHPDQGARTLWSHRHCDQQCRQVHRQVVRHVHTAPKDFAIDRSQT